jgi:hypothetical protein
MTHLRLTPEGPPLESDRTIPIDDPDEPITEAGLRELELDRAADEGMIEPPEPEMEVLATDVPGPEDEPREPGDEVPGPEDEPHEPETGRDDGLVGQSAPGTTLRA